MNVNMFNWLKANINKYNFLNQDAENLKNQLINIPYTEGTQGMYEAQVNGLYSRFTAMFNNNILSCKNGINGFPITSYELDCYFIETGEGIVPIGYYKSIRPAESVSMIKAYLDECKIKAKADKNSRVELWQRNADKLKAEYSRVSAPEKKSSTDILSIILSVIMLAFSVFAVMKLNLNSSAEAEIPIVKSGVLNTLLYLTIIAVCAVISIISLAFVFSEKNKAEKEKEITERFINTISYDIGNFNRDVEYDIDNNNDFLYNAAMMGTSARFNMNMNASMIIQTENRFREVFSYINNINNKKSGSKSAILVLLIASLAVIPFSFMAVNNESVEVPEKPGISQPETPEPPEPVPPEPEPPKKSSYSVIVEDITWEDAAKKARDMGGYLVCINDAEEYEKVYKLAENSNLISVWLGGCNTSLSWDNAKWLDGTKITYTRWLEGEPSGRDSETDEREYYLMMFKVNGEWYYNDCVNDVTKYYKGKIGYIVEIEE